MPTLSSESKLSELQTSVKKAGSFRITDLCCPTCAVIIEKALAKLPGVQSVSVSYFLDAANVEYDPDVISAEDVKSAIQDQGFSCIQRH